MKRPRGVDIKNEVYFLNDATPSKSVILLSSERVIPLKELSFFLIWRYQKTYTRELFESLYGKMFGAVQEYLDNKRSNLNGINGMIQGIPFGDKTYKFKQSFYVHQAVPLQFQGANFAVGLSVDRVCNPAGMEVKAPAEISNAYKELKTILGQELDYMGRNPALQQK